MKKTAELTGREKSVRTIYPPPVMEGDTLGLVAPAGPLINRENFTAGINLLEKRGFRVKYNRKLLYSRGYLAGSDRERADEFNSLWSDPQIKGLVAARGGYGCMRMVDLLDMNRMRKTPKILVGFSDLTVLLTAIHQRTGLVTFHGPVVTTLAGMDKKSQTSFFHALAGAGPRTIQPAGLGILKGGKAKGILFGGNLTTLVHLIATPFEIPWRKAILFIEDIGESPYRLDRLLTQLSRSGRLHQIKGLILGTFSDDNRKENSGMQRAVRQRVLELLEGADIPVWENFPVGHSRRNLTLPIGVKVEMDSSSGKLQT